MRPKHASDAQKVVLEQKRVIGPMTAALLIVGNMVGAGVFTHDWLFGARHPLVSRGARRVPSSARIVVFAVRERPAEAMFGLGTLAVGLGAFAFVRRTMPAPRVGE